MRDVITITWYGALRLSSDMIEDVGEGEHASFHFEFFNDQKCGPAHMLHDSEVGLHHIKSPEFRQEFGNPQHSKFFPGCFHLFPMMFRIHIRVD